jgi:hypothetical protein
MSEIMFSRNTILVSLKKLCMKFRFKYLLLGSKETFVGSFLTGQFPNVVVYIFIYTLLLSGIISDFKVNVYMHLVFAFSCLFITAYSFFNEVLYDSADDMRKTVVNGFFNMLFGMFISPKRPI